jgi:multicomponent Na+:H+ antiporter subunit E
LKTKRPINYLGELLTVVVLTLVWIVYSEKADLWTILQGVGFSILGLLLTNIFVLKEDYRDNYHVSLFAMLKYIPFLFIQIYLSGFDAIYRVFTRQVNVGVVDITTELPDDYLRSLLATAITLTPGTVTLNQEGKDMTIIWLNCATTDPVEAGESIKGSFERILLPRTKNPKTGNS